MLLLPIKILQLYNRLAVDIIRINNHSVSSINFNCLYKKSHIRRPYYADMRLPFLFLHYFNNTFMFLRFLL